MLRFKDLKDKYSFLQAKNNKIDYIFLDLEFNSFTDDYSFHEITSIGAIKCDSEFKNINCFHSYVVPISYEKTKDNNLESDFFKITNKRIPTEGESFYKAIYNFLNWIGDTDCEIFVWGTSDIPVLISNLKALNIDDKFSNIIKRIKNIQPEVSSYIKVLGNPINYSISLENMKKLFFLNKNVTHNALLDSIDLMKVFKEYKKQSSINQDILYELSYIYRNVDTEFQFERFKSDKNKKNRKFHSDLNPRLLINNPSEQLVKEVIDTLNKCDFKFTNEYPRFTIENQNLMFNKFNLINNNATFNTLKDECNVKICDNKLHLNLKNNEKDELLTILTKYLPENLSAKLKSEMYFSSNIYKDITIDNFNIGNAALINYFIQNGNTNFSNNIKKISIINNHLYIKRKKDNNANISSKHNCNFYIKTQKKHYDLILNYKSSNKNTMQQKQFVIPKNNESKAIVQELISINMGNKKESSPKFIDMNENIKEIIIELANSKAVKTKRKAQVFVDGNRLKFLTGRYVESIALDNVILLVKSEERPSLLLKNVINGNIYELKLIKNKDSISNIKELFKYYNKFKPKMTKIQNFHSLNTELLNKLKKLNSFEENNNYIYHISNGFITINRIIKNEYQNEIYPIDKFYFQLNFSKDYNMSINIIDKENPKKSFITGISSKKINVNELCLLLDYLGIENKKNFSLNYFSKDLLNILRDCKNRNLIVSDNEFLDIDIQAEHFKIKKKFTNNQLFINLKSCSIEIIIYKQLMFLKVFDDLNEFYYSIQNTSKNRDYIEKLFKFAKKYKSNSWIKVFEINKNIRNSIWRVAENSKNDTISSICFDNKYLKTEEKKYFYQNTPLSLKRVSSDKLLLKIGVNNSSLYDISINEKNKIFIDDLINNTLFYEDANIKEKQ
ncbi:MAG: hypothetical protein IJ086_01290 [Clostridium sp.]|nr:hypothetical protein [Clostridium sp.]